MCELLDSCKQYGDISTPCVALDGDSNAPSELIRFPVWFCSSVCKYPLRGSEQKSAEDLIGWEWGPLKARRRLYRISAAAALAVAAAATTAAAGTLVVDIVPETNAMSAADALWLDSEDGSLLLLFSSRYSASC